MPGSLVLRQWRRLRPGVALALLLPALAAAQVARPASAPGEAVAAIPDNRLQLQRVQVPSQDGGIVLPGYWFPAPRPGGAAVVALHGCGGLGARGGKLGSGQQRYAQMLNEAGVGVLFTESFEPRGEKSLCSQKPAERRITELNRRLDVYGALAWLAAQPGVDGRRLGVIGWSHGGQTVLFSADRSTDVVAKAAVQPAALVAFYPGCTSTARSVAFQPVAPLLVMSGALDNWTAAAPCRQLVQRLAGQPGLPTVEYIEFPDSYHGFDGVQPVRELSDIGGTVSGRAMIGGNPAARAASAQALMRFVATHLKP